MPSTIVLASVIISALQNELLEGLISEDDFYKEIEEKEDEYVVEEKEAPSLNVCVML